MLNTCEKILKLPIPKRAKAKLVLYYFIRQLISPFFIFYPTMTTFSQKPRDFSGNISEPKTPVTFPSISTIPEISSFPINFLFSINFNLSHQFRPFHKYLRTKISPNQKPATFPSISTFPSFSSFPINFLFSKIISSRNISSINFLFFQKPP